MGNKIMENEPKKLKSDAKYYIFGVKLMLDLGFTIAIPAVLAALLGQYLDSKYDKYPLFLIICLVVAFLVTARIIYTKAKAYAKEYENIGKDKTI